MLIAGIAQFSCVVAIWNSVTARRLEDTPLGAIGTGPPIRILSSWELSITLAVAERVGHVTAVVTHGLSLGAASKIQPYATLVVAWEERPTIIVK